MNHHKLLIGNLSPCGTLIIAPLGLYLNKKVCNAKRDDLVTVQEAWRKSKVVLERIYKMRVNASEFTFWTKRFFGETASWQWFAEKWTALCINEGLGKNAFSNDEVLCLSVRPYVKEEHEAIIAQKARIVEMKAKEAEKERLLKLAKEGIYDHPSIKS